jgi:hypothetical protein
MAGAGLLAGLGLSAQLIAFRLMGDSFLPISALIKTSGARGSDIAPIDKLAEVFVLGMPSILQGRFPTLILILLGFFGVLVVILASVNMREWSSAEYTPYFIWYRSPSFIFWIITGSLIALFAFGYAGLAKKTSNALRLAPVGLSLVVFALAIYMFARSINFTSNLYVARYKAAEWIAQNSAPDTVFAAWNAGQLSFFSNRTFINLDGLINNSDYYERVLRGSVPLSDYLAENNVAYIVDYSMYHLLPAYPVVRTFPLQDETGRSIQIWEVSPHLSSTP